MFEMTKNALHLCNRISTLDLIQCKFNKLIMIVIGCLLMLFTFTWNKTKYDFIINSCVLVVFYFWYSLAKFFSLYSGCQQPKLGLMEIASIPNVHICICIRFDMFFKENSNTYSTHTATVSRFLRNSIW